MLAVTVCWLEQPTLDLDSICVKPLSAGTSKSSPSAHSAACLTCARRVTTDSLVDGPAFLYWSLLHQSPQVQCGIATYTYAKDVWFATGVISSGSRTLSADEQLLVVCPGAVVHVHRESLFDGDRT